MAGISDRAQEPGRGRRTLRSAEVALGIESNKTCYIFTLDRGQWRLRHKLAWKKASTEMLLLKAFCESQEKGFLPKNEAIGLLQRRGSAGDKTRSWKNSVVTALSRLRGKLRERLRLAEDPFPFDAVKNGFQAKIHMGYAIEEERFSGDVKCLRFVPCAEP